MLVKSLGNGRDPLKRIHVIEFEDFIWCPVVLRDAATAYLRIVENTYHVDHTFTPHLKKIIAYTQEKQIVDLCSGAGGPLPNIVKSLKSSQIYMSATMTDKHPNEPQLNNLEFKNSGLEYCKNSIEATDVHLPGIRTLFNAFHHFKPAQARRIISDAVRKNQAIGIFEIVERKPGAFLSVLFAGEGVFFLMPLIKPRKLSWFALTYLIPLIPLLVLWDGIASCFRVYSPDELNEIIASIPDMENYHWEISQSRLPYFIAKATILIGYPKVNQRTG